MRGWRFRQWYRDCGDAVYSHAYWCLGNCSEAEDIAQEAFLRLWEHMDAIDGTRVRGWLLTVTHRLCIDHIRQRKPVSSLTETEAGGEVLADPVDLEAQLADRADLRRIMTHLQVLPPDQRSVLLLRFREDMSYTEIAEVLSLSLDNVKILLHRGRRALRWAMQEVPSHG